MATIYLSSTYSDLKAYREVVYDTLRKMRYDVIAMEDYVATDQRPLDKCLTDVSACDLYIGLFAWRYGYIPTEGNPEQKSITELEYRQAIQMGKHCLLFLFAEDAPWPPLAMDAVSGEGERGERISALRREFAQEKVVSFFKTAEELASLASSAVHLWEKNRTASHASEDIPLAHKELQEERERITQLRALIADHSGFMRDRLESFVGREKELTEIQQRIDEKQLTGGYVTITGQAGQGKSSIIAKLVEGYGAENVAFHFIPLNPGPDHQVGLLRNLMARLILKHNLSDLYVASDSRAALRDYFPKVLAELTGKGAQEVIFVDGLDQLEEDFSGARDLSFLPLCPPQGVVFVLGTRPNDTLRPLELLKPHCEYKLPNLSRHDFDLILHHRQVDLDKDLADQFYQVMQENALYLDLVARELTEEGMMVSPAEMIKRIAHDPNSIFSLAMNRLRQNRIQWREVIKPVLGVLLTAREPLSLRHIRHILEVEDDWLREGIEKLGGLIAIDSQQRCSLFHLKLQDYLRQDENNSDKKYIFAIDEEEGWHKKLSNWCEQGNLPIIWQDIKDNPVEQSRREYARRHFVTHLYQAKEWQHLFTVLNSEMYGKAKAREDPSTRSFANDLNLGRYAAARKETLEEGLKLLPQLWRYTLLVCSLTSRADKYPIEAFEALMLLNRESEAVGLAELLTKINFKVEVLLLIALQFGKRVGREQEYLQMLLRTYEVACMLKVGEEHNNILSELSIELAKAQQWDRAEKIALSIRESDIQAEVLNNLSRELFKAQQWDRAEKIALSIKESKLQAEVLSNLSFELAKAQQWDRAEKIALSIRESKLRAQVLGNLSRELFKAQQWDRAEEIVHTIEPGEVLTLLLSELSIELAKAQQWDRINKVVSIIEDREVLTKTLRELVIELAKARLWEQAEKMSRSVKDHRVLDRVKGELAIELAKANQWEQAEEKARTIKDHEILDRVKGELAIELAKASQWEQAEEVAYSIETYNERTRALVELSIKLIKAQQWEPAEKVARSIEESGERIKVLGELSTTLAKEHHSAWANGIWMDIRKEMHNIEGWKRIGVLSELFLVLDKVQQWERAEKIIRSFKKSDIRFEMLYALVAALAKAQQWERAEEIWIEAEETSGFDINQEMRKQALYELGIALSKAQQWERADVLWVEAEEQLWETDHYELFTAIYCELITALVKAQQYKRAEKILEKAEEEIRTYRNYEDQAWMLIELGEELIKALQRNRTEEESRPNMYIEKRAKVLLEFGRALAKEVQWERAEEVADTLVDRTERTRVLSKLSIELAKAQQWERAEEAADKLEEGRERTRVLSELSIELAKAQQWERAEKVASKIEEGGERTRVLYELVALLAKAQQWDRAEKVWSAATEMNWADKESVQALSELGTLLFEAQKWEEAEKAWMQAKEAIHSFQKKEESVQALVELSTALVKAQKWEEAEEVWTEAEQTKYSFLNSEWPINEIPVEVEDEDADRYINNVMCQDQALIKLISALIQAQQGEQGEIVAHMVEEPWAKAEVLIQLGTHFAQKNQWEHAERVWSEAKDVACVIEDNWIRVETLRKLSTALARAEQWKWIESLVSVVEEPWDRTEILIQLGTHLAQRNHWEHAERVWSEANEVACMIEDNWIRVETLRKLSTALTIADQWKWVESLVRMIGEPRDRADVLIQLGTHLTQRNQWEYAERVWSEANEVAHTIWAHKTRFHLLQKLGTALAKVNRWDQAENLWIEAEEVVSLLQEQWDKDEALGEISKSLALIRRWQRSQEVAKKINDSVYRSQILTELGMQLAIARQWERAKAILVDVESVTNSFENIETKVRVLKKIAKILNIMQDHEQLLYLVQHSWLQANTREDAIILLPLVYGLISLKTELGTFFCESFKWADNILKG